MNDEKESVQMIGEKQSGQALKMSTLDLQVIVSLVG
jgi:hypothetical protein